MLSVIIAASCVFNDFKNYRNRLYVVSDISFLSLGSRKVFVQRIRREIFLELHRHLLSPHACNVKSEIISTRSARADVSSGGDDRAELSSFDRAQPHQSGCYMQMHVGYTAWPHSISCHRRSDAICISSAAPARYTAGPVIALLMNSAVWIDWPADSEGERTRAGSTRVSLYLFLFLPRNERDVSEPIVSMQSVAPNEFRTGWKNRWHVIYDDVYINEKCASGRRHVALSPPHCPSLRSRQSSTAGRRLLLLLLLSMRRRGRSFRSRSVISMSSNRRSLEAAGS